VGHLVGAAAGLGLVLRLPDVLDPPLWVYFS
jgi:hypothetical protein